MSRKICVVTGSRADYGLLRGVMDRIRREPGLTLQLLVTGMHWAPEFGGTAQEIVDDGFVIDEAVEMLLPGDTALSIAKSTGQGVMGCAEALARLAPDVLVALGDRFEILAAVTAALFHRIPELISGMRRGVKLKRRSGPLSGFNQSNSACSLAATERSLIAYRTLTVVRLSTRWLGGMISSGCRGRTVVSSTPMLRKCLTVGQGNMGSKLWEEKHFIDCSIRLHFVCRKNRWVRWVLSISIF